jgi:outer membrane protein, heavy metal efflux system
MATRPSPRSRSRAGGLVAVLLVASGCVHGPMPRAVVSQAISRSPAPSDKPDSAIQVASASEPTTSDAPFAGRTELIETELVAQVLARNPTVAQMTAAAQAAAARFPQVTSLEDPRAGGFFGPASIGSRSVDFAYRVEVSQAFPYPGKLALRGEAARNEAAAAASDVDDARLTLAEAARSAFADYFLAARAADVNAEGLKLLGEFRENAAARYRNNQAEQQDIFQADVAIARQKERSVAVDRMRRVAQARLNTLLNRPADDVLPSPPKALDAPASLPPATELRELAAKQRPDLAAVRARVAADEAAVGSVAREFYPDFEAMAAYDAWWQSPERDLRPMVGVRLNIPIRTERRNAALAEAQARLAQRKAELARAVAQAGLQVQEAYEQAREAEQALKLYEESALPAAREQVRLAQASYTTGKVPFLTLIEAQRSLIELRDRQFELQAEARRRRAALDRATGTVAAVAEAKPTSPPPKDPPANQRGPAEVSR